MYAAMIMLCRESDYKNLGSGCKSEDLQRAVTAEGRRHSDDAVLNALKEVLKDSLCQRVLVAHNHRKMQGAFFQNCLPSGEYFARHAAMRNKWERDW